MCEPKPYQVWFSYRLKTIRCSAYITSGSLPCTATKLNSENDPKKKNISVARWISPLYIWTLTSIAPVMARSRVQTPLKSRIFFQASLRKCINCVHCDDHFFIFRTLTTLTTWKKIVSPGRIYLRRSIPRFLETTYTIQHG